jgi:hypothetical protein
MISRLMQPWELCAIIVSNRPTPIVGISPAVRGVISGASS